MGAFRSDNNAGLCPEAMDAIVRANERGHAIGYGDDEITSETVELVRELFGEPRAEVFFVATGTAGNTLAIASMTEPWQRVVCHEESHWNEDESTAPERITHCRTTTVHPSGDDWTKLTPADIERVAGAGRGDVHQPGPGVLTVSNATEYGTVYSPAELRALCDAAHAAGYRVQVDGARFANAVAQVSGNKEDRVNQAARSIANDAGVDVLTFGGTKNGLAFGEMVVFFPPSDDDEARHAWFERAVASFPHHRKGTGHLLSKHRFASAPFHATLSSGAWLRHAGHANAMAKKLSDGLVGLGLELVAPTQANAVFVRLTPSLHEALVERGHGYYLFGPAAKMQARLMCSFDTTLEDVDGLLADVGAILGGAVTR